MCKICMKQSVMYEAKRKYRKVLAVLVIYGSVSQRISVAGAHWEFTVVDCNA